jgi:hypothetical protein
MHALSLGGRPAWSSATRITLLPLLALALLPLGLVQGCATGSDPDVGGSGAGGNTSATGGATGASGRGGGGAAVSGGSGGAGSGGAGGSGSAGGSGGAPAGPPPSPDAAGAKDAPAVLDAPADGPAADAGTTAPPTGDAGAPVIGGPALPCKFQFCESFEGVPSGAPADPAVWTSTSADLVVSSERAARGKQSLHVPPINGGNKYIRHSKSFSMSGLGSAFYGRMFLWVERFPIENPADNGKTVYHWTTVQAAAKADGSGFAVRLGGHKRVTNELWLRLNIEPHSALAETGLFDKVFPQKAQRWYCVEFYLDSTKNEARFWYDGVERTDLHWQNKMPAYDFPDIQSLAFGWAEYQGTQTPFEAYIDEIALDPNPIGCDR